MGNAGTKMAKMAVAPKNIAIGSLITSVLLAALLYVNGSAQQCPVTAAAYEELLGQLAQNAGELGEARAELASLRSTTSATLAKGSTHSSDRAVTTSPPKRQPVNFYQVLHCNQDHAAWL